MSLSQYLAFLGVSLLVICTPGQDTALTIRNTLGGDRRTGTATALGVTTGQATWTVATSAGLALILVGIAPLFFAIRIAGAGFLLYLGARALRSALQRRNAAGEVGNELGRRLSLRAAFTTGLVSNLSNAKMVAFFLSLLPPFAGVHPSFLTLVALGLNFCVLTLTWLVVYAFAIDRMSGWLRRPGVRRLLDGALGATLFALGLRVGSEAMAQL